ncbi:MAG: ribosome maturation factor RimM [Anaerolineae bacterium]
MGIPSTVGGGRNQTETGPQTPSRLTVARVAAPWGVRGEVKAELLTDFPDRFAEVKELWLGDGPEPLRLERFRKRGGIAILKFRGLNDRDAAESLRGEFLSVPVQEAVALEEHEYYEHQILGMTVVTLRGEMVGRVEEVLYTGANDVYRVQHAGQERLIPAVPDVVLEVDIDGGRLVVSLPEEVP